MSSTHALRPYDTTARHRILTANIHISAAILIAALLLMLMLLWHISTITLVENYMMPEWWVKAFLAEHANGWRVGVWVLVGVLVSVDCVHALSCLDWWSAMLYERRGGKGDAGDVGEERRDGEKMGDGSAHNGLDDMGQAHLDRGTSESIQNHARSSVSTSASSGTVASSKAQPHSYHPFLHKDRMRDRCIGLNMDIHVAGGFAVFMAIMLGLLHLAALVVRVWEMIRFGRAGVVETTSSDGEQKVAYGSMDGKVSVSSSTLVSLIQTCSSLEFSASRPPVLRTDNAATPLQSRIASSIATEERSTGIRFVDWSAERMERTTRRRIDQTEQSEALDGTSKWSEVLLECLIDE
ncbi:hypothetical protein EJ07DRAFT_158998 [Lizonia empirigonia]|nr:hypothetical protein EJ07DRAFT_158998 [Lizonia empirigonia]